MIFSPIFIKEDCEKSNGINSTRLTKIKSSEYYSILIITLFVLNISADILTKEFDP